MIRLETQYCNLNRILLLAVGLWPYQQSKFTQLQFIFFSVILLAGIVFQLTPLIILKCTLDLVTKVLSSVSFFILCMIQYNGFRINIEAMKNLLMELRYILNELKDKNEIAIVYKYSGIAQRYTVFFTILGICGVFIIIITKIWLNIIAVNASMNTSESYHLLIITEYFIGQKQYFYLIVLYMYIIIWVGTTIMVATGSMFMMYFQHICGMFRIASYRIEHAVNINILQDITLKNIFFVSDSIICAIDIHRQAMKLSEHLVSKFEVMIFTFTGFVVICFSFNLFQVHIIYANSSNCHYQIRITANLIISEQFSYRLFQIMSSKNNFNEFFLPFLYIVISILYMFITNYIGENIIDHNNHVFLTAYNIQWYRTPLHIQKMILFLLQRKTKKFTLQVGGLMEASIEHFATLVKTSISYFTVMYSTK